MSAFVDEIVKDITENPNSYNDYQGYGVSKNEVMVYGFGNTKLLSVIRVLINGKMMPTTYVDRWKLESALKKWYANAPLSVLIRS